MIPYLEMVPEELRARMLLFLAGAVFLGALAAMWVRGVASWLAGKIEELIY